MKKIGQSEGSSRQEWPLWGLRYPESTKRIDEALALQHEGDLFAHIVRTLQQTKGGLNQNPIFSAEFRRILQAPLINGRYAKHSFEYGMIDPEVVCTANLPTQGTQTQQASCELTVNLRFTAPTQATLQGVALDKTAVRYNLLLLPERVSSLDQWKSLRQEWLFDSTPISGSRPSPLRANGDLEWQSRIYTPWQDVPFRSLQDTSSLFCYIAKKEPTGKRVFTTIPGISLPRPAQGLALITEATR